MKGSLSRDSQLSPCWSIYNRLCTASRAFERDPPKTEQTLRILRRNLLGLIEQYRAIPEEKRRLFGFDVEDFETRVERYTLG